MAIIRNSANVAAFLLLSLFLRYIFYRIAAWQKFRTARKRYGCERPARYPHRLPFGIDLVLMRKRAIEKGRYNPLFQEHFARYGATWEESQLGLNTINSTELANRHAVLSTSFKDYGPPPARREAMLPFLGPGIFSEHGRRWRQSRDLITPVFSRSELSDIAMFQKHVDRLINKIPRDRRTVDLQPLLNKLFLDSSTEFIFGESLGSLSENPVPGAQEFLAAFQRALIGAGRRGNLTVGRAKSWFMFDTTWKNDCSTVHTFVDRYVERALDAIPPSEKLDAEDREQRHKLSQDRPRYVLINEMARLVRNPVELRSEILNVFFPSRDSTAIALSNTIFHLARNPSVWTELRNEALALGDQELTFDLLKKLHLFRYAIFEGVRLQGPSGRTSRSALRDTILPVGGGREGKAPIFVPKGTLVQVNSYPVFRDSAIWGDDANEFRPSRFVGREKELITAGFRPFLEGPRSCPARQQVLTQGVYLLVRLVKEFEEIENRDPCLEYVEMIRMLCESRNGVKVSFNPEK